MALPFMRRLRVRLAHSPSDFGAQTNGPGTLETLARHLLAQPGLARVANYGGKNIFLMHSNPQPEGVYLHLVVYAQGEAVTTLGDPGAAGGANALQAQPPPPQRQYADATLLYLIWGNNVLCCRSGTSSDSYLISYLTQAAIQANVAAGHHRFELSDRADVDKLQMIQREGISSLTFNSAASEAAVVVAQRDGVGESIIGAVLDQLRSLSGQGVGAPAPAADMKVEVKLSLDKRKAALVTDPLVMAVASQAVAEDDPGFRIVTASGKTISADDVKLNKSVVLTPLGKHPDHQSGWDRLREYKVELTT